MSDYPNIPGAFIALGKAIRNFVMRRPEPARLDADRTAKPKTRLIRHAKADWCVGPHMGASHIEDENGVRTPLSSDDK